MRQIILEHRLAPGDETVATAVVRDIKRTYGDAVTLDFRCNFTDLFRHNPYLTPLVEGAPGVERVKLCYKSGIISAGKGNRHHFLTWFHRDFAQKTGLDVPVTESKPDLHLTLADQQTAPVTGRYWLVFGGGKTDFTTKHWDFARYQQVVDRLRMYGLRFAQSGATRQEDVHPRMQRVLDLVGWGKIRELMWQIYHCEGIICPITCAMHMAAAFDKPCVVIAGGREENFWEAYTNDGQFGPRASPLRVPHRFLHTIGMLDCCLHKGCWKNKVVKINKDNSLCRKLASRPAGAQPLPECMQRITVDHVVEAVMSYYQEGYLAPVGVPRGKLRAWYAEHQPAKMPVHVAAEAGA